MEEQEKIDIRKHLIGWIDIFLEDGIVPRVVNPKAIRTNYILKSKVKEKIEELNNNRNYLSTFKDWKEKDFTNEDIINNCVEVLQELMEDK